MTYTDWLGETRALQLRGWPILCLEVPAIASNPNRKGVVPSGAANFGFLALSSTDAERGGARGV